MKRSLKLKLLILVILAFEVLPGIAQTNDTAKKRAEELLIKARHAIGGDEKIKAVKSISLAGKFQRDSAIGKVDGTVEFDFLFPDKFINTERLELPIGTITLVSGIDGETAWQKTKSSDERIKFRGYTQKDIEDRKRVLSTLAGRWILGLLLRAPNWSSLELTYAGEAEVNGKLVNQINVNGTDGFSACIFLDKTTDRLTMMSYILKQTNSETNTINQNDANRIGTPSTAVKVADIKPDEVRMRFADYRSINGIQLPHYIQIQSGEGNKEEWEFTKIQLNTPLAPNVFKGKNLGFVRFRLSYDEQL